MDEEAMSQGGSPDQATERARERILVTGAAGFIGSHLVERLLDRGDSVVGVDDFDPFYSPDEKRRNLARALEHPRFRLIEADCADLDALEHALGEASAGTEAPAGRQASAGSEASTRRRPSAGSEASTGRRPSAAGRPPTASPPATGHPPFDAIVHLAAKAGVRPSIEDPLGYTRANVVGTQCMLELARRQDIRRFVFGSSSSVYGNNEKVPFSEDDPVEHPISPYAATKRACELLCHTYHHLHHIGVLSLRFFTVYGPRQRPDLAIRKFATLMMHGEPIPMYGDGTSERDYTWIDDILQGVVAAIDRTRSAPGEYEIINLGESRTTALRHLIDLIADALDIDPEIQRLPMQPGDVLRTYADVDKARRLLGYEPTTPVEVGIPRFVEWLRTREPARAQA